MSNPILMVGLGGILMPLIAKDATMNERDRREWYLECINPAANERKFYEVKIVANPGGQDYNITTRHGRITTKGKGRERVMKTKLKLETAIETAISMVEARKSKGYNLVQTKTKEVAKAPVKTGNDRFSRLDLE